MPRYDAYFLRVWRGEPGDGDRWSCRLEHLPDGGRQRFGSLKELLACLEQVLEGDSSGCAAAEPAGAPDATAPRRQMEGRDPPRVRPE